MIPLMNTLPHTLYRSEQVRELDRIAIEEHKLPGFTLMSRAGQVAFDALRNHWPQARSLAVVCGPGNNGGDAYIVARLAHEAELSVQLFYLGEPEQLSGDARTAADAARKAGVSMQVYKNQALDDYGLIVDGLLGTGLSKEVQGLFRLVIEKVNAASCPVLSLDIPSGLDADSGRVLGTAINADVTISFIALKRGLFTADGSEYCGELLFDDLDIPAQVYEALQPSAQRIDHCLLSESLKPRSRTAHKGDFGHVLVIGGEQGMAGAARLAGEAAARVGAGLVSIATRASHAALLNISRPELMCHGIEDIGDLNRLLDRATVVAIGPGLGQGPWGQAMLSRILDCHKPLVLDADALNLLAIEPARREQWVLTPHPGEAARLLGCSSEDIQQDRFSAVAALQASYGGVCVLKGAGSLILDNEASMALCSDGNPGMAIGGMGDALTGIIAGLIAQNLSLADAARLGVCLHAAAADEAAREGERGLLASDLMPWLRKLANPAP